MRLLSDLNNADDFYSRSRKNKRSARHLYLTAVVVVIIAFCSVITAGCFFYQRSKEVLFKSRTIRSSEPQVFSGSPWSLRDVTRGGGANWTNEKVRGGEFITALSFIQLLDAFSGHIFPPIFIVLWCKLSQSPIRHCSDCVCLHLCICGYFSSCKVSVSILFSILDVWKCLPINELKVQERVLSTLLRAYMSRD